MRHYVVVFLESGLFPGTWMTDHFVRREEREEIPKLPVSFYSESHATAIVRLKAWQNEEPPDPAWTLEECLIGGVGCLTAIWYGRAKEEPPKRVRFYKLHAEVTPNL